VIWQSSVVSLVLTPLGWLPCAIGGFLFSHSNRILVLNSFFSIYGARFAFRRSSLSRTLR
jgi:hypothetical protein